ncbi:hypothetical protein AVEN_162485-1 [Araneus ventricosus]|uniref:Uncharacterized protein n=1 Tax=Araneus ventricosus TaxID=182803 RepID=A0A4Y2SBV7_ARAVE|nr:hypothetical protein AVEN_162485-1 [Araneus ventricosus]
MWNPDETSRLEFQRGWFSIGLDGQVKYDSSMRATNCPCGASVVEGKVRVIDWRNQGWERSGLSLKLAIHWKDSHAICPKPDFLHPL